MDSLVNFLASGRNRSIGFHASFQAMIFNTIKPIDATTWTSIFESDYLRVVKCSVDDFATLTLEHYFS